MDGGWGMMNYKTQKETSSGKASELPVSEHWSNHLGLVQDTI